MPIPRICLSLFLVLALGFRVSSDLFGASGEFELRFVDATRQEPVAVRFYLFGTRGRPRRIPRVPYWHDHQAVDGQIVLKLSPGHYTFRVERGPEYRDVQGSFQIQSGATDNRTIEMQRIVDMRSHGWWPGDTWIEREYRDLPLLLAAEDLYLAGVTPPPKGTSPRPIDGEFWEAAPGRWGMVDCTVDASGGGRLVFLGGPTSRLSKRRGPELPPSTAMLLEAAQRPLRELGALDAAAWDLPVWIASRRLHLIAVHGPSLTERGVRPPREGWREHDPVQFPRENGAGPWAQFVYFQLLNCGLPVGPIAASGSGVTENPPGYNRVYAHVQSSDPPTPEEWWQAVSAGRVLVTNGPLMLPRVNDEYPGHTFRAPTGQKLQLQPSLSLYTREKIDYLEIIRDGRVLHMIRLDEWTQRNGELPRVEFERSGWLAIRAVTNTSTTYRACLTGAYHVQIGDSPRVSRSAVRFFLDWLDAREASLQHSEPDERPAHAVYLRAARKFWNARLDQSNDD